jgi:hypothetical protein
MAALRPPLSRAHTAEFPSSQHPRSGSTTPTAAIKLGQRKKEKVDSLTFYLSIRKVYVQPQSSRPGSRPGNSRRNSSSVGPARRRCSKDSRIVITLSDDRALSIVREALAIESAASVVSPPPLVPVPGVSDTSSDRGRREGRSALSPRPLNSGSRDARQRREDGLKRQGSEEINDTKRGQTEAVGLKMDMGRRKSIDDSKNGGGGIFDLASFVGRLVGSGAGGSSGPVTS